MCYSLRPHFVSDKASRLWLHRWIKAGWFTLFTWKEWEKRSQDFEYFNVCESEFLCCWIVKLSKTSFFAYLGCFLLGCQAVVMASTRIFVVFVFYVPWLFLTWMSNYGDGFNKIALIIFLTETRSLVKPSNWSQSTVSNAAQQIS